MQAKPCRRCHILGSCIARSASSAVPSGMKWRPFSRIWPEKISFVAMVTLWPLALSALPRPITGWTSPELPIAGSRILKAILDGGPASPRLKDRHPAVFEVFSITALCLGNITGARTGAEAARP